MPESEMVESPIRCAWRGMAGDPLYEAYHDTEWGVPEYDSRALWEKLVLDGFDPEKVAAFGAAERARLMADAGIVRSNAKIDAAIASARAYLEMREKGEDFSAFCWGFVDGAPVQNRWTLDTGIPAQTPLAVEVSKALKAKGFKFVGPVIVYAWMQAVGMVNDHVVSCFRHEPIRAMGG